MTGSSIKRIFIANRGEIVIRIAQTAKILGIGTVAIADKQRPLPPSLFVIDKLHYLDRLGDIFSQGEHLCQLAIDNNCDAVHPGYGFLSENAEFAQLVMTKGLSWIGPRAEVIAQLGNKNVARDIAQQAGVPVIEGVSWRDKTDDTRISNFVENNRPPYIVKAAAGGGGKGMRQVISSAELLKVVHDAGREANSLYRDGEIVVERLLTKPRHIEVQIIADQHGNVTHLGDRECSVQRRFQKIIEEAPAPRLTDQQRQGLHEAAIALTRHVNYDSVGTVEFLVDDSDGKFYFLEMNTRLQVEHTVSEEIYNVDLVAEQIRLAEGQKISSVYVASGQHSIQARIYAEDASRNFLPCPGTITCFEPFIGLGIRWEIGCYRQDEIVAEFDPMLAKVIVTADNRQLAIARMQLVLDNSFIAGIVTNLSLLVTIFRNKNFITGQLTTKFISEQLDSLLADKKKITDHYQPIADKIVTFLRRHLTNISHLKTIFSDQQQRQTLPITIVQHLEEKGIKSGVGFYDQQLPFRFALSPIGDGITVAVGLAGQLFIDRQQIESWQDSSGLIGDRQLCAPVPGKVVKIAVQEGETVDDGYVCLIIESMKMEFAIKAQGNGQTVDKIHVAVDDLVTADQLLIELTY